MVTPAALSVPVTRKHVNTSISTRTRLRMTFSAIDCGAHHHRADFQHHAKRLTRQHISILSSCAKDNTNAFYVMSKPNPGSVAHPKPRQSPGSGPAIPKPRLPPRPPILTRPPPRIQRDLPRPGVESQEAQKVAEAVNTRTLWETIIRRKKLVSAIAFGVVVVAGSILGARIKESRQEYAKLQEIEEAAKRLAEATAAAAVAGTKIQESTTPQNKPSEPISVTQAVAQQSPVYNVDIARQITLLEDRKAILNRQKANYEQKIQRLRERQVRKQEMEARRPQPVQVDK